MGLYGYMDPLVKRVLQSASQARFRPGWVVLKKGKQQTDRARAHLKELLIIGI